MLGASAPLHGGERVLWQGHCGVAEYAFDRAGSLPRWTLPEHAEVTVTDHRVLYAHCADPETLEVTSGELRWLWPQHLRLQPGSRDTGRNRSVTQVQLVCGAADGSFPALVFAGGDLTAVTDADRLANVIRQAIARFRIDNAAKLGLSAAQSRMLSRLLIGPEFLNHAGGSGQTVSLLGALPVSKSAPPEPADHRPDPAVDGERAADPVRVGPESQHAEPDLASRAARIAAQVAELVSAGEEPAVLSSTSLKDAPTVHLTERARVVRRSARMAANSARDRVSFRRNPDREVGGITSGGNRGG